MPKLNSHRAQTQERRPNPEAEAANGANNDVTSADTPSTAQGVTQPTLTIPDVSGLTLTEAALVYARCGWYVGRLNLTSPKHPGSYLGNAWETKTTRDPAKIRRWFEDATQEAGLFVHVGRSGAVAFDVDHPEALPEVLREAIARDLPPYQATRDPDTGRGHYLFATPGAVFSNSGGALGGEWGEVRGKNGIIVVEPTARARQGKTYRWARTGALPVLPPELGQVLREAGDQVGSADTAEVERFLAGHSSDAIESDQLIDTNLNRYAGDTARGQSRHNSMLAALSTAMKDARTGHLDAPEAVAQLRAVFVDDVKAERDDPEGEFDRMLAQAVGYANNTDAAAHEVKIRDLFPNIFGEPPVGSPAASDITDGSEAPQATVKPRKGHTRTVRVTPTSKIPTKKIKWLWDQRLPRGELSLLSGREGLGKSTFAFWIAAQITHGTLPGDYLGQPKAVLICATEDDFGASIVPRLQVAGADLDRVYRIETQLDEQIVGLSLPHDTDELARVAQETDAALLILDPLMSRLDAKLDTHKDSEVRQALEPMVSACHKANVAILGLMHHNKSGSTDPSQALMGSRAFPAVSRAAHTVVPSKDDPDRLVFAMWKSNYSRIPDEHPAFRIESAQVMATDGSGEMIDTSKAVLDGMEYTTVAQALEASTAQAEGAQADASEWLSAWFDRDRLPGQADYAKTVKAAAKQTEVKERTLDRARKKLGIVTRQVKTAPDGSGLPLNEWFWVWERPQQHGTWLPDEQAPLPV